MYLVMIHFILYLMHDVDILMISGTQRRSLFVHYTQYMYTA